MNFNGVKTGGSGYSTTGIVATGQDVGFGTFVKRSADGYVKMVATGSNVHGYLGVADDDTVMHTYNGLFDAGDKINIITEGNVNAWLIGGQTVNSGDYLKFPTALGAGTEGVGVLYPESANTKTLDSVAKYIGRNDAGNTDYDQTVTISGSTVTCANLADIDLVEGDSIIIDSNEAAEFNTVADPSASSTTFTTTKTPLASHANAIKVYKLVQILVRLE